jgi:outer membrane protein assembly factor BamB
MRFEIVVAPSSPEPAPQQSPSATLHLVRRPPRRHVHELLDVFVDGANVTARIRERHGAFVLRDLALALVDLSTRERGKASVRFYDEPWEMCVERFGAAACLSVYRSGPDPLVAVYDRAVPFADIVTATRDALDRVLANPFAKTHAPAARLELVSAATQLRNLAPTAEAAPAGHAPIPAAAPVVVELDRDVPLSFGAEFAMRAGSESSLADAVERADLHALLFRGRVRADIRGRAIDLGDCHPFLVAERLVELARRAFDSWERGLPLHARGESAGILVGLRVDGRGQVALTLGAAAGPPGGAARRPVHTFPALGVADMLEAALSFGRSLVRAILRRDRSQSANLRLSAFRRTLREGTEALREASQTDSKVNPTPEPYRAFAAALHEATEARSRESSTLPAARLRYATRWRAIVPGIDLRATYLCGDRMIVGAASEMWALDRATGRVLWRVDVARGTSVVTPGGIARLASDGTLAVHDFGTGEVTLRARIAPRVGGPVSGAVVHLPGLPKLVIVTEGEHHLVAIDLTSGEQRWRWSWSATSTKPGRSSSRTPRAPRLKRAGRLLYVTCGDGALTALDVMTGAVVWRVRDRLRFRTPPTVAHDALFVVAGGAHGVARLYCIDAFSGRVRWTTDVTDPSSPCTVEGAPMVLTGQAGGVAVAVRNKRTGGGLSLVAFRPEDGSTIAPKTRVVAPSGTSWLAVDDAFIGNAPSGELVAIAADGELLWRNVLGPRPLEADVPRRLEPVLRSGALFVPQTDVVVVRPRDGAVLGTIAPTEAIPDLLRVDERADVYVAEESGHLVCFGALPRLSLV